MTSFLLAGFGRQQRCNNNNYNRDNFSIAEVISVVCVVCHFVTPRVAPVLPVVPVVSVVVKIQKRLCAYLCKSVKSVGEAGGLYVIELSVRLLSYCIACRE